MDARNVWFSDDPASAVARGALLPFSLAYGAVSGLRRVLYRAGALASYTPALPCISVGNLTVGGTGKTPMAAWLAARLHARVPTAIVLRDYGGDEGEVHRRLTPGVTVITNPDRVAGVRQAQGAGARIAVLDDALQHRRIRRSADVVLLSVEQLRRPRRLLPAGPWREPLSVAGSADLIVLTRKSASRDDARVEHDRLAAMFPGVPIASVSLEPQGLASARGHETQSLEALRGKPVLAIAAIGEPEAFRSQLEHAGARVQLAAFRDHHPFSRTDVEGLAASRPDSLAVCTLKDAVKLAPLWPAPRALWYVSQRVVVESGAEQLERLCARVLDQVNPAG